MYIMILCNLKQPALRKSLYKYTWLETESPELREKKHHFLQTLKSLHTPAFKMTMIMMVIIMIMMVITVMIKMKIDDDKRYFFFTFSKLLLMQMSVINK